MTSKNLSNTAARPPRHIPKPQKNKRKTQEEICVATLVIDFRKEALQEMLKDGLTTNKILKYMKITEEELSALKDEDEDEVKP